MYLRESNQTVGEVDSNVRHEFCIVVKTYVSCAEKGLNNHHFKIPNVRVNL